jgi:hypothetical protein
MRGGYESLSWINDRDGKEYVCTLERDNEVKSFDQLTEAEKKRCFDVNVIVGTERW